MALLVRAPEFHEVAVLRTAISASCLLEMREGVDLFLDFGNCSSILQTQEALQMASSRVWAGLPAVAQVRHYRFVENDGLIDSVAGEEQALRTTTRFATVFIQNYGLMHFLWPTGLAQRLPSSLATAPLKFGVPANDSNTLDNTVDSGSFIYHKKFGGLSIH